MSDVWTLVVQRLTAGVPGWPDLIAHYGQVTAVAARKRGRVWTDHEVFEALVRAVLSNSTDWAKVERVLPELRTLFRGFDADWYASATLMEVDESIYPWFKNRRAGSMTLRGDLIRLMQAAKRLCALRGRHGTLDSYLTSLHDECIEDPITMAMFLGSSGSAHKVEGLGIPLAAEFLKNVGFDVSKPDRHINRAAGSFGWVAFRNWERSSGTTAPAASPAEMRTVMETMHWLATSVGEFVAFVDNAIWILCAKSGAYLSNQELSALAKSGLHPEGQ